MAQNPQQRLPKLGRWVRALGLVPPHVDTCGARKSSPFFMKLVDVVVHICDSVLPAGK